MLTLPVLFCTAGLTLAADKSPPKRTESSAGQWVFSILPKSFQKNPLVDQTIMTEMTDAGRKLPAPSPENPAYYLAQPAGYHVEGPAVAEKPPAETIITSTLVRALAVNGYQPAGAGHPPTLLLIYFWGAHNHLDPASEMDEAPIPDVGHKNLLSRAALVGGIKFAAELRHALEQHDRLAETMIVPVLDPLKLFIERDAKTRQLYEQSLNTCYYVVASAYDYPALARGEGRRLLWRSKMTVDANGVSMADTLPTLVLNAGKYLGRDMPESATITKRLSRDTQVKLGPLDVKEYLDKPAPPQPETKP